MSSPWSLCATTLELLLFLFSLAKHFNVSAMRCLRLLSLTSISHSNEDVRTDKDEDWRYLMLHRLLWILLKISLGSHHTIREATIVKDMKNCTVCTQLRLKKKKIMKSVALFMSHKHTNTDILPLISINLLGHILLLIHLRNGWLDE